MNSTQRTDCRELNIRQIVIALLRRCWLIALSAALCTAVTFLAVTYVLTPQYQSTVTFYTNNNAFHGDNRFSSSDLYASEKLIDSYVIILNTGTTLSQVVELAEIDLSQQELADMLSVQTLENTTLFSVSVSGPKAETVGKAAQAIATVLPQQINGIMQGVYTSVADPALIPTQPFWPSPTRNMISAFLFGCTLGASIIVLQLMFDRKLRSTEDITELTGLTVLATIPPISKQDAANITAKQGLPVSHEKAPTFDLPPSLAEEYRHLGARLSFAFADTQRCHVLGISSAMAGEGKSTSAVCLSAALAQAGFRVLLLDCDLRRPTVHEKLKLHLAPGMSELLTRQAQADALIHPCQSAEGVFDVICAGRLSPNPQELLHSPHLPEFLSRMRQNYDYILLDLPPVGEVGDALSVSPHTDGILLLARQGYCDKLQLQNAVQQLHSVDAKLTGVVMNCTKKEGVSTTMGKHEQTGRFSGKMLLPILCGVLAVAVVAAIVILGGGGKKNPTGDDQQNMPELVIQTAEEQADEIVLTTSYCTVTYPYAFSDLLIPDTIDRQDRQALTFSALLEEEKIPLYTIWFGGNEGTEIGKLTILSSGQTVPVMLALYQMPGDLPEEHHITFSAVQETLNDVLTSLSENRNFTVAE